LQQHLSLVDAGADEMHGGAGFGTDSGPCCLVAAERRTGALR
jgi:hypothetical protein